jgi:hypothetical protein
MNKDLIVRLREQTNQPTPDCKEVLSSISEELAEKFVVRYEKKPQSWFFDFVELTPDFEMVIGQVELEVSEYIEERKVQRLAELKEKGLEFMGLRGMSDVIAREKQRLLKEKYGIQWKTSSQGICAGGAGSTGVPSVTTNE